MTLPVTLHVSRFGSAPAAWFERAEAALSDAERYRLPKRDRAGAWRRHILSRRLMRFAASARLGRPDVRIDYPEGGPPCLTAGSPRRVAVSMSHCCETAAVILCDSGAIGCDILSVGRAVHWQQIAATFFCKADYAWMMEVPDAAAARFRSLWCIKEALAKCSGKPLLECLRQSTTGGSAPYWAESGTVADCAFAVVSNAPLSVDVLEIPIEAL